MVKSEICYYQLDKFIGLVNAACGPFQNLPKPYISLEHLVTWFKLVSGTWYVLCSSYFECHFFGILVASLIFSIYSNPPSFHSPHVLMNIDVWFTLLCRRSASLIRKLRALWKQNSSYITTFVSSTTLLTTSLHVALVCCPHKWTSDIRYARDNICFCYDFRPDDSKIIFVSIGFRMS